MEMQELQKRRLGFFQKIRKNLYLINMSEKKAGRYHELPDYLKNDQDIIDTVVNYFPALINSIPFGSAKRLVQENPKLIEEMYAGDERTQLILTLSEDTIIEYMHLLPKESKKKAIMNLSQEKKAQHFEEIMNMFKYEILFLKEFVAGLSTEAKVENLSLIDKLIHDVNYMKAIIEEFSPETIESNFPTILKIIGNDTEYLEKLIGKISQETLENNFEQILSGLGDNQESLKRLLKYISKDDFAKYEQAILELVRNRAEKESDLLFIDHEEHVRIERKSQEETKKLKIFCKEYIELLGEDEIQILQTNPKVLSDILSLSSKKLEIYAKCIKNHMQKAKTEEWTQIQYPLLYALTSGEYDEFIESLDTIDETNIEFISSLLQKSGNIYGIKSKEDMLHYSEIKKLHGDKFIQSDSVEERKLAVLEKVFGQDIAFSELILLQYGAEIDKLPDSDIKHYVQCIKLILGTDDPDLLEKIYNECEEVTFVNQEFVERSLKSEFFKMYKKTLFDVSKATSVGENIYDAGTDFSMIVRCENKGDNYREMYEERKTMPRQYFSTSYIRNDMISVFGNQPPDVCFGYSDLRDDSLIIAGTRNLSSNAHSGLYTRSHTTKYCMPDAQINQTNHHNELCLRTTQNGEVKLPDYIVVFKVNGETFNIEEAKKAQKDLDNIPIVVVDINACLQAEKEKVDAMIAEYKKTKSPELAAEIAWKIKNNRKTYAKMCEWTYAKKKENSKNVRDLYNAIANNEEEAPHDMNEDFYADLRANNFFVDFDLFDIDEYTYSSEEKEEIDTRETKETPSKFETTKHRIQRIISDEER